VLLAAALVVALRPSFRRQFHSPLGGNLPATCLTPAPAFQALNLGALLLALVFRDGSESVAGPLGCFNRWPLQLAAAATCSGWLAPNLAGLEPASSPQGQISAGQRPRRSASTAPIPEPPGGQWLGVWCLTLAVTTWPFPRSGLPAVAVTDSLWLLIAGWL